MMVKSQITASTSIDQVKKDEMGRFVDLFAQDTTRVVNDLLHAVNGRLDFENNFGAKIVNVVFTDADTETAVAHGIGRPPRGYIVTSLGAATTVYNSGTPWTANTIYLSATIATSADLLIF